MASSYYIIYNTAEGTKTPITADGFQGIDGWMVFYIGAQIDRVVIALPPGIFYFTEVEQEEYLTVMQDLEDEEAFERQLDNELPNQM